MPTFRYNAYTAGGKAVRGRREALDAKEVREKLLAEGLYAREVRAVSENRSAKRYPVKIRSMFFHELGALLKAGLPLDRALQILSEHPELGAGEDVLPLIRDRVREGQNLSLSLQQHMPGIREDEVAVLAAGEAAGNLPRVAAELAVFLDEESVVRDQLRGALIYPAVISVLALVVLGVLVGFLLPVYEKLLGGLNQALPPLTHFMLKLSALCRHPASVLLLLTLFAGMLWFLKRCVQTPETILSRKRYRLPVLGFPLASLARARFARTLSLLMAGGVDLPAALKVSGRATGSVWLSGCCDGAAEKVSQGMRVTDAVSELPVLQEDLPGWIRAGEASGDLAGMLHHASESHQRAWNRGLSRSLALVEPLLIVSVGVLILLVALAVLLPMLKINQTLGF